ncbi:MAG: hypothetical protein LUF33_06980 [Clostridiales bacterium]|nr:hypothetical protein [Clostridiales bacterium]
MSEREELEAEQNYAARQVRRFERREKYSLDPDNRRIAGARKKQWENKSEKLQKELNDFDNNNPIKSVANSDESGIINYAKASDVFLFDEDEFPLNVNIKPDDIINELETSEVGSDTIEYLENNKYKYSIRINYEPQTHSNRGDQCGTFINIYMDNIANTRVAAQTVIHEVAHMRYDIGNCQWAEAVCMAKEKMHIMKRTYLTVEEKRYIVKLAREHYSNLN